MSEYFPSLTISHIVSINHRLIHTIMKSETIIILNISKNLIHNNDKNVFIQDIQIFKSK